MMRLYNSSEINVIVVDTNNMAYIKGAISNYADEDESRVLIYCEGFRCEVEGEYGHINNARGMEFDEFVENVAFFDEDVARRVVCDRMTGYEASYRGLEYLADVFCAVDPYALQTAVDCNLVFVCDACDACEFEKDGASIYQDTAIEGKAVVVF